MGKIFNYWKNKSETGNELTCANVSFFRLLGQYFTDFSNKKVLEVGFGDAADILECKRRGADIYGLDLASQYINRMRDKGLNNFKQYKAGSEEIPFNIDFDLIYCLDMLYYLSDMEINKFLTHSYQALSHNSLLIIQILEQDYQVETKSIGKKFQLSDILKFKQKAFFESDNPIRILKPEDVVKSAENAGFFLVGGKLTLESYDELECNFRLNRYFVFQKGLQK